MEGQRIRDRYGISPEKFVEIEHAVYPDAKDDAEVIRQVDMLDRIEGIKAMYCGMHLLACGISELENYERLDAVVEEVADCLARIHALMPQRDRELMESFTNLHESENQVE